MTVVFERCAGPGCDHVLGPHNASMYFCGDECQHRWHARLGRPLPSLPPGWLDRAPVVDRRAAATAPASAPVVPPAAAPVLSPRPTPTMLARLLRRRRPE